MRIHLAAKIHGARVTGKELDYHGSVTVGRDLLDAAGIAEFEQVHVVNLANGARWITYALAAPEPGVFRLNGGGARLGEIGDRCIVMAFAFADVYSPARVLQLDERNAILESFPYERTG